MTDRRRKSAHALVGMMAFLVLGMLLWTAVFRQTSAYLRTERACRTRVDRDLGCTQALAWGLTLLETGYPSRDPYSCRVSFGQTPKTYVLGFAPHSGGYSVSVRPATQSDSLLPQAPPCFTGTTPPGAF